MDKNGLRFIGILIFVSLAACSPLVSTPTEIPTPAPTIQPSATQTPEPTQTFTPVPTQTVAPTGTPTPYYFNNTLEKYNGTFSEYKSETTEYTFKNGGLLYTFKKAQGGGFTSIGPVMNNSSIQIDTNPDTNPSDIGVYCRKTDTNSYLGLYFPDGYYGIYETHKDSKSTKLIESKMPNLAALRKSEKKAITLKLDCNGDQLSFYVNDYLEGSTTNSDIASGNTGMYLQAKNVAPVSATFNNLIIIEK